MTKPITVRWASVTGVGDFQRRRARHGWALQPVDAQIPPQAEVPLESMGAIESLSTPGQRLLIRGVSKSTGLVTFASSGDGIELPLQASVTPEERALSFVDLYGAAFWPGRSLAAPAHRGAEG